MRETAVCDRVWVERMGDRGGEFSEGCLLLMWGTQIRDSINRKLPAGWDTAPPRHDKCR